MSAAVATASAPVRRRGPALVSALVHRALSLASLVFIGLVLSVLIDWMGMTLWWPEEGSRRSARMLEQELEYLRRDFGETLASSHPAVFAEDLGETFATWSGGVALARWLSQPPGREWPVLERLRRRATPYRDYAESAVNVARLYGARVGVVLLSIPAFLLFATVALVHGLVRRDLRRFGGGHESAMLFHHLVRWIKPVTVIAIAFYMDAPVSLHPNTVFIPAVVLMGFFISNSAAMFKKYV